MTVETAASQFHPFRAWRSRIRSAAVVLLVIVAVLCTSPLHLPLNNPNEGVRVFAAKALVEHGTFAIDQVTQQWGYIDDKARHNGKLYSSKAPLVSLLAAAAYAVIHPLSGDLARPALTRLCRVAGDILPSLFLVLLLWRSLRRTMKDSFLIDVGVVGIVLGTGVLASLHVLSGHAPAALGPAVVLALCLEPDEARRHRPLTVGALPGMA